MIIMTSMATTLPSKPTMRKIISHHELTANNVNVDKAESIGKIMVTAMNGKLVTEWSLKKNYVTVKTFLIKTQW